MTDTQRYKIIPRATSPISWEAYDTTDGRTVARGCTKEEVEEQVKLLGTGPTIVLLTD